VTTKLYGLIALVVGAVLLGPARAQAQTQSEAEWLACMEVWEDEGICGPRPEPPPPPPEEEPLPPPEEEPLPPPEEEPLPPPPPPEPPLCAKGKHGGHSVAAAGYANGHRCAADQRGDRRRHKHGHGGHGHKHGYGGHRGHGHVAKAKAAINRFLSWCKSFAGNRGRR
jgi:hypothetical protein